jgi:hypothetical protein
MGALEGLAGSLGAITGRRTGTLAYTGPKSGRPIELKVWAVPQGDTFLVGVGKHTAKSWWKAFRGGLPATFTWYGTGYAVAGRLLDPARLDPTDSTKAVARAEWEAARAAYLRQIPLAKVQMNDATPVVVLERITT